MHGYVEGDFPHSEKASECVLSLPMSPWVTKQDIDKVIWSLIKIKAELK